MLDFYSSRVKNKPTCKLFCDILILILVLIEPQKETDALGLGSRALSQDDVDRDATTASSPSNLLTGPVVQVNTSRIDLKILGEQDSKPRPANLATGQARRVKPTGAPKFMTTTQVSTSFEKNKAQDKKHEDTLSTDCLAKRNEILHKLQNVQTAGSNKLSQRAPSAHSIPLGFQRLRPKNDGLLSGPLNGTFREEESEHVPQCTPSGRYEPIQCHKIGYCWCVNKYGQAIKNSAALADDKPDCDSRIYESESNDLLVVTGVSANRLKALLRGSSHTSSTPSAPDSLSGNLSINGDFDGSHSFSSTPSLPSLSSPDNNPDQPLGKTGTSKDSQDAEFNRRVSESPEPSLSLIPNECSMSRENARARAEKLTDDSIWVPECDQTNEKLYAGMQCHKSRVCWCVDQITGLPLRTSEQLTMHAPINCTEIRGIVDTATAMFDHNDSSSYPDKQEVSQQQQPTVTTFSGFSESCDAHMRVEFVQSLIDQFKHQLNEYVRSNPTVELPDGLASPNPYRLNEIQVARWKFASMDSDHDDKLDDREWSRFKNNFKLVDSSESIQELFKQRQSTNHITSGPLGILRGQRRCWRDFLQFCGNGDLLSDEMISLPKWLSCTELPSKSKQISTSSDKIKNFDLESGLENTYANSKAAAINRSKHKNPFLGILKPN